MIFLGIGARISRKTRSNRSVPEKDSDEMENLRLMTVDDFDVTVVGLAVSWSGLDAFYISLVTGSTIQGSSNSQLVAGCNSSIFGVCSCFLKLSQIFKTFFFQIWRIPWPRPVRIPQSPCQTNCGPFPRSSQTLPLLVVPKTWLCSIARAISS